MKHKKQLRKMNDDKKSDKLTPPKENSIKLPLPINNGELGYLVHILEDFSRITFIQLLSNNQDVCNYISDYPMDFSSKNHTFFRNRHYQDGLHDTLGEDESSSNVSYRNTDVETNTDLSDNEVIDIIGETDEYSRFRQ